MKQCIRECCKKSQVKSFREQRVFQQINVLGEITSALSARKGMYADCVRKILVASLWLSIT
jgi:hypothetical protein